MACPYCKSTSNPRSARYVDGSKHCLGGYYPQNPIDSQHFFDYCRTNSQDNYNQCMFFPLNYLRNR